MKFLKAFIPVLCIIIFESLTNYRDYMIDRNFILMAFSIEGYLIIIFVFYLLFSKNSLLRNISLFFLVLVLLARFYIIYMGMRGISLGYSLNGVFIVAFLVFVIVYGAKQKSIYTVLFPIIGIGIYLYQSTLFQEQFYQSTFYEFTLLNDAYDYFAYTLKHSLFTSFGYTLTYIVLLLSPIYLGFLSLCWKKV